MKLQATSNYTCATNRCSHFNIKPFTFIGGNVDYSEAAIRTALEKANVEILIISEFLSSLRGKGSIKQFAENNNCNIQLRYFQSPHDKPNSASLYFRVEDRPYVRKPINCESAIRIENGVIVSDDRNADKFVGQGANLHELLNAALSHIETKLMVESYN